MDPRNDNSARVYAENCLAGLPRGALVITRGDQDTFPLWYYHYGLRQRPDVSLVSLELSGFDWYAEIQRHTIPPVVLPTPEAENWEGELARLNLSRPICQCAGVQPGGAPGLSCVNDSLADPR